MERFLLRLPASLKERLEGDARERGVSLNALIVERLDVPVSESEPVQTKLMEGVVEAGSLPGLPAQTAPSMSSGKRSYEPDPKGGKKK